MNNNRVLNNNSKYVVHYNFRNNNNGQLYNYNRKEIRPEFIDTVNMRKLSNQQRTNYLKELAYYIKCSLLRAGAKPTNAFIQQTIREVLKPTNIANLGNNVINLENIQPTKPNSPTTTRKSVFGFPNNSNSESNAGQATPKRPRTSVRY